MRSLSDIITVSLGAAALVTLVCAKDRPIPTPGIRTAIELTGHKTQASSTLQRHRRIALREAQVLTLD